MLVGLTSAIGVPVPDTLAVDINLAGTERREHSTGIHAAGSGVWRLNKSVRNRGRRTTSRLDGEWAARDRVQPTNSGDFTETCCFATQPSRHDDAKPGDSDNFRAQGEHVVRHVGVVLRRRPRRVGLVCQW